MNKSTGDPTIVSADKFSLSNQFDLFPEISVENKLSGLDKLIHTIPEPHSWPESVWVSLIYHLVDATWANVIAMFQSRLDVESGAIDLPLLKLDKKFLPHYIHTLDWLLGNHEGAIPLDLVLSYEIYSYEMNEQVQHEKWFSYQSIRKLLRTHPVLSNDCFDLEVYKRGGQMYTTTMQGESGD